MRKPEWRPCRLCHWKLACSLGAALRIRRMGLCELCASGHATRAWGPLANGQPNVCERCYRTLED